MSSGTGESRHYTGPATARDAQIMTTTAPPRHQMAMSAGFQSRWMPDAHMTAHLVGEMAAWSAWHRRRGPDGKLPDDQTARRATIECGH
jgi:hypothetical protein